ERRDVALTTDRVSAAKDIRTSQCAVRTREHRMPLSPSDWWVHVQSTRDLADRMLVRGDTRGAKAMLQAALDLEKRYDAAMETIFLASINRDAVAGSAEHLWATTIQGRSDEVVSRPP